MERKTAETMIAKYVEACDAVNSLEVFIHSAQRDGDQEAVARRTKKLEEAKEQRDMLHAFALSAIKSLTPARGFTV